MSAAAPSKIDDHLEKALYGPYNYIREAGGKKVRSKLFESFNHWIHVKPELVTAISEIVEMLHNSSLIIDDIEDSSDLRRGVPVAHHVFGLPLSLNSACHMYFKALERALALGEERVPRVFTEQMLVLHRGQGLDLYWRDTFTCPSLDDYRQMVKMKTGGLFGLGIRLLLLFADAKEEEGEGAQQQQQQQQRREEQLLHLADLLGVYFQIRDDYCNLASEDYHNNKSYCEDLTEGKYSYPLVWAIQQFPNDDCVASILRQRTRDTEVKRFCVQRLRELGAIAHTVQLLQQLHADIVACVAQFPQENHLLLQLIANLSEAYANEKL